MAKSPSNFSSGFKHIRRGISGLLTAGLIGIAAPVEAISPATETLQTSSSSIPEDAVSLFDFNPLDIIRNTIEYIQVATISNEQEVELGQQINQQLLEQNYQLYTNPVVNQYVDQIGQRLVAASNRRDIPYTFQVVQSDEINAFAIPGGYIYVTTGLLQAAENEAQLAAVLAHEIAHVNQRHSVKALRQAVLAQGIAETAGIDMNTLAQIGYRLALDLPRSREFEYEADRYGLATLTNAGYAPIAFVNFFEKLQDQSFPPEFLRTHPTSENRIDAIAQQIPPELAYAGGGLSGYYYQQNVLSQL